MPEGLLTIIAFLALGYVLLLLELFVPGGIIGGLGVLAMAYGTYLAFGVSTGWGMASVGLSLTVTALLVRLVLRSRAAHRLVLDSLPPDWKAAESGLEDLLGREGRTLTDLRPAGMMEIDDRRLDVVADSEFLDAGTAVRVVEVEGNRVVVEPVE